MSEFSNVNNKLWLGVGAGLDLTAGTDNGALAGGQLDIVFINNGLKFDAFFGCGKETGLKGDDSQVDGSLWDGRFFLKYGASIGLNFYKKLFGNIGLLGGNLVSNENRSYDSDYFGFAGGVSILDIFYNESNMFELGISMGYMHFNNGNGTSDDAFYLGFKGFLGF